MTTFDDGKQQVNIGILGLGVVGGGAVRVLTENADAIARKVGLPLVIHKIAVRDRHKPREVVVDPGLLTERPEEVIDDPDIDIVCELIGGVEPAHSLVLRAIRNGKHIVTANKEMMAKAGHDLLHEAENRDLDFNFEGSVGGGIPIIQPLKQALAANQFSSVMGIVNGTTNYILSKMTAEDADFGDVLAEAQVHGYAEADPTNDIEGYDAQYKTAILSSIAFTSRVLPEDIYVEGITQIAKRDIAVAKDLGYVIKIVGIGQDLGDALQIRVHPVLLPKTHPLASVSDVHNAIYLRGNAVGDVMFYGRGAGALPTGSAVVGDIIEIARNLRRGATGRIGCTCYDRKPDAAHRPPADQVLHPPDRPRPPESPGEFGQRLRRLPRQHRKRRPARSPGRRRRDRLDHASDVGSQPALCPGCHPPPAYRFSHRELDSRGGIIMHRPVKLGLYLAFVVGACVIIGLFLGTTSKPLSVASSKQVQGGLYDTYDVSRDGRKIVFSAAADSGKALYLLDLTTWRVTQLTNPSEYANYPAFSPSGKSIVYEAAKDLDHPRYLFIRSLDGKQVRQLTSGTQTADSYPYFSGDGKQIVFARSDTFYAEARGEDTWDHCDVYIISVDGTGLRRMTHGRYSGGHSSKVLA